MAGLVGGVLVLFMPLGCTQRAVYEIDFTSAYDFEWDGKLRITKVSSHRLGPLLTLEEEWRVEHVELLGRDGRVAQVDPKGYREVPLAGLGLGTSGVVQVFGTCEIFRSYYCPTREADREALRGTEERKRAEEPATTSPATQPGGRLRSPPQELYPYVDNAEQLDVRDWWAVALQESEYVAVDFLIPGQDLRIIVQGDPRHSGPDIIEVRTRDGRLIERYEETQIEVKELTAPAD
ncbi:MAG: hypothetical protein GY842_10795 [bacterium]|nr:hypothetical protein [bacterium]